MPTNRLTADLPLPLVCGVTDALALALALADASVGVMYPLLDVPLIEMIGRMPVGTAPVGPTFGGRVLGVTVAVIETGVGGQRKFRYSRASSLD